MAKQRSRTIPDIDNTGFGTSAHYQGTRLTNRDGSFNLSKQGIPFLKRFSIYHTLLRLPRWLFVIAVFGFYTILNLVFAVLYFVLGVQHLEGAVHTGTVWQTFSEAFFFSSQTLTTVGYGRVAPEGLPANILASIESLVGIVSFALVTGVFYGRFSRPKAYILFSKNLLLSPYKDGTALMLRLATFKNNHLTDAEVQVTLTQREGAERQTKFYTLKTALNKINSLALNWTIVHEIDEQSPFHNCSQQEIADKGIELLVFIKAFDDHFSNTVQQRSSYTYNDMVFGARFLPMYHRAEGDNSKTILELDKISDYEKVALPVSQVV